MNKKVTITSLFMIALLISFGVLLPEILKSSYAVSTTFADTIMNLASTDACNAGGTGVCATNSYTADDSTTKYHDYRFRGADPNNYVSFNNDIYRVIGVFDSNTHGVEGKYLVKLIRSKILGSYSWGVSMYGTKYKNDWTGNTTGTKATVNILLNEYFYNKSNVSLTYGNCKALTYYGRNYSERTFSCSDIVGHGINNDLKDYIEEVTWYLRGYTSNRYNVQDFYLCERGLSTDTTNCMSANSGEYDASTVGKIGLMYVSDYIYAGSGTDGFKNWLYKGAEWTITPQANDSSRIFAINTDSRMITVDSYNSNGIRPTFYLKSNVNVTGTGTFDDPYKLSM